jgi:hypothetical protein
MITLVVDHLPMMSAILRRGAKVIIGAAARHRGMSIR